MMQQLYIDGKLADIGEGVDVALELKSNLLTGADNFSGNSSLTITLPTTVRNRDIISHADIVQGGGNVPYQFHNIEYYRNGVQIIRGGVGRLLSTKTDGIEIAIVWGIRSAIDALMEADDTLNAISTDAAITFNGTPITTPYADALTDEVFYAAMDVIRRTGVSNFTMNMTTRTRTWESSSLEAAQGYIHPCVRMNWILSKLETMYSTTFDFGAAQTEIDAMIVPLITKVPNDITFSGGYKGSTHEPTTWGSGNYVRFDQVHASPIITTHATGVGYLECATSFSGAIRFRMVMWFDTSSLTHIAGPMYIPEYGYDIVFNVNGTPVQSCSIIGENSAIYADEITGAYVYFEVNGELPISMDVGDQLTMQIACIDGGVIDPSLGDGIHIQGGNIYITDVVSDEVMPGQDFPVAGNLPDIKPIDLIKFLCAVTGTFPVQSSTASVLTFKPVADVFDWSHAEDWSRRLLSVTDRPVAAEKAYDVDGWAQQNWFKWKNDATVTGDYDGSINVDNETLEQTRDVITFPFAATDGNNIPMYTYERKWNGDTNSWDTDIKWSKVEPRVLQLIEGSAHQAVASFDMGMDNILASKYGDLAATMAQPSVITETIRISDVELAYVDESKAIYIGQHGAYFALLSLTTNGNETAEVKLLKLTKEA